MRDFAPIALFVYNRPEHTRQTLESLMRNDYADQSQLFIYCDGPKPTASPEELRRIMEVRTVIREQKWCKEVKILESKENLTHPVNLVNRVTELLNEYKKLIVLEDDLVLGKGFIKYMNEALELYKDSAQVMQISGYMFPVLNKKLPNTFFVSMYANWGWATWKRAWDAFIPDAKESLLRIQDRKRFDLDGSLNNYDLLYEAAYGPWKYWDLRWYASIYLNNGLVLFPNISLVRNIGHDSSGMHCEDDLFFKKQLIKDYVNLYPVPIEEHLKARKSLKMLHILLYDSSFFSINNFKNVSRKILPQKLYNYLKRRKNRYLIQRANESIE